MRMPSVPCGSCRVMGLVSHIMVQPNQFPMPLPGIPATCGSEGHTLTMNSGHELGRQGIAEEFEVGI